MKKFIEFVRNIFFGVVIGTAALVLLLTFPVVFLCVLVCLGLLTYKDE